MSDEHEAHCPRGQRIKLNEDRDMMRKIIGIQPCTCHELRRLKEKLDPKEEGVMEQRIKLSPKVKAKLLNQSADTIAALTAQVKALREGLEEISRGPFMSPQTSVMVAKETLAKADKIKEERL